MQGLFAGDFVRRRRGLLFAVPAAALALLIVIAALNFDSGSAPIARPSRITDAQLLLAPSTANAQELAKATASINEQTAVKLPAGAWVQVADETGRLAQQYSATKLEPLQGAQLAMTEPRAMMYLKDGRVLVLSARNGVAYVPRRALESGTLTDDVIVRLFKPIDGRAIDINQDTPAVVVNADHAQFDGVLGEVRCEKAVRVSTDAGSFAGEGLLLQLDSDGKGLESLTIDRATEPIRVDRALRALEAKRRGGAPSAVRAVPSVAPGITQAPSVNVESSGGSDATSSVLPGPTAAPQAQRNGSKNTGERANTATRFYRLTMLGGVSIVRVKDGVSSVITGEELVAVFSLESNGLGDIALNASPMNRSHLHAPLALAILPLAFALPQDIAAGAGSSAESSSDSVTITFGGKLIMVPATAAEDQLASADDIRFDVTGQRVEVLDERSHSHIRCSHLRYSVRDESLVAQGRADVPLTVMNPRMTLEAPRFEASLATGVGRIEGAGRMAFSRGVAQGVSLLEIAPASIDGIARMLVSSDPAASALIDPPVALDPASVQFDPSTKEIEITWKDGVDLRFEGAGDAAKLSLARFGGGVNVFGRQFELDSHSLEVMFSPTDSEQIDAIIADGGTTVRRLGGEGAMSAQRLELFLARGSTGDTIPRRLVARNNVSARDERQTIWSESLTVGFHEKDPSGVNDTARAADNGARANAADVFGAQGGGGNVDIDLVEASGGVQVLLKEGARVFADALVADASKRRLRLTGEDVAIIRSNVIADNLRDLHFDDATRSARSEGPGRFRAFKTPLSVGVGKVERPAPTVATTLDATWSNALEYSEVAENHGTLDIRGDVKVRSHPNDHASDAVDAQSILLELGVDTKAKDPTDAARTLDHFIAKGDARLESRTWETAEKAGDPRVFRVSGEHVEYDMRTREGLVVGNGAILVHVPKAAEAKTAQSAAFPVKETPRGAIALGVDGTTRFRWTQRMALTRQYEDVFKITMQNDVETLHAGLRTEDALSMRCDMLEATVRRPLDAKSDAKSEANADATAQLDEQKAGGVDLGGPAEMLGVKGIGHVFIRTPEQDIECGEFDYSAVTGIATLQAEEGRTVTVSLKGQPTPIRAERVIWDLRNGRLEVSKASGTGAR